MPSSWKSLSASSHIRFSPSSPFLYTGNSLKAQTCPLSAARRLDRTPMLRGCTSSTVRPPRPFVLKTPADGNLISTRPQHSATAREFCCQARGREVHLELPRLVAMPSRASSLHDGPRVRGDSSSHPGPVSPRSAASELLYIVRPVSYGTLTLVVPRAPAQIAHVDTFCSTVLGRVLYCKDPTAWAPLLMSLSCDISSRLLSPQ